jgi:hypothetical protein
MDQSSLYLGYIVNIHDPTTFNISLEISDNIMEKISKQWWTHNNKIITSTYEYYDEPPQLSIKNNSAGEGKLAITHIPLIQSKPVYRCRIRSVGVIRPMDVKMQKDFRKTFGDIKRQVDLQNGWVLVKIYHPDKYKRLLVDLYDPITKKDLKELFNFNDGVFIRYYTPVNTGNNNNKYPPGFTDNQKFQYNSVGLSDRYAYHRMNYNKKFQ